MTMLKLLLYFCWTILLSRPVSVMCTWSPAKPGRNVAPKTKKTRSSWIPKKMTTRQLQKTDQPALIVEPSDTATAKDYGLFIMGLVQGRPISIDAATVRRWVVYAAGRFREDQPRMQLVELAKRLWITPPSTISRMSKEYMVSTQGVLASWDENSSNLFDRICWVINSPGVPSVPRSSRMTMKKSVIAALRQLVQLPMVRPPDSLAGLVVGTLPAMETGKRELTTAQPTLKLDSFISLPLHEDEQPRDRTTLSGSEPLDKWTPPLSSLDVDPSAGLSLSKPHSSALVEKIKKWRAGNEVTKQGRFPGGGFASSCEAVSRKNVYLQAARCALEGSKSLFKGDWEIPVTWDASMDDEKLRDIWKEKLLLVEPDKENVVRFVLWSFASHILLSRVVGSEDAYRPDFFKGVLWTRRKTFQDLLINGDASRWRDDFVSFFRMCDAAVFKPELRENFFSTLKKLIKLARTTEGSDNPERSYERDCEPISVDRKPVECDTVSVPQQEGQVVARQGKLQLFASDSSEVSTILIDSEALRAYLQELVRNFHSPKTRLQKMQQDFPTLKPFLNDMANCWVGQLGRKNMQLSEVKQSLCQLMEGGRSGRSLSLILRDESKSGLLQQPRPHAIAAPVLPGRPPAVGHAPDVRLTSLVAHEMSEEVTNGDPPTRRPPSEARVKPPQIEASSEPEGPPYGLSTSPLPGAQEDISRGPSIRAALSPFGLTPSDYIDTRRSPNSEARAEPANFSVHPQPVQEHLVSGSPESFNDSVDPGKPAPVIVEESFSPDLMGIPPSQIEQSPIAKNSPERREAANPTQQPLDEFSNSPNTSVTNQESPVADDKKKERDQSTRDYFGRARNYIYALWTKMVGNKSTEATLESSDKRSYWTRFLDYLQNSRAGKAAGNLYNRFTHTRK